MMKIKSVLSLLLVTLALTSCHSNEENYKAAYDKAMERHMAGIDQSTYDKIQNEKYAPNTLINGDSVRLMRYIVNVVDGDDSIAHRYNVVVAGFKQIFNAQNYRDRLHKDEGYPAYVLEAPADKKYYVIAKGFDNQDVAASFLKALPSTMKMKILEPSPWILQKVK
ncbi:MAG: SPOR domain-containing protein [Bacteroidales bacterium]|nr:SPOR domain-containing protein [Candidatus Sodaliphilus aphodohippi]